MALRIIETPAQLDAAYDGLAAALTAWAGPGGARQWRSSDALEPEAEGASFARRDDLHLYLERTRDRIALGAALTPRNRDLVRVEFSRAAPARRKHRAAFAFDDAGDAYFLMISTDALKDHDIRDPFRRLAGAPLVKRAELGGRDYLMIGPLDAPRIADALFAVAGVSPAFEKHIAKLGAVVADEDERQESEVYAVSRAVERAPRAVSRVISALHEHLMRAGFQLDAAEAGALKADFVMSRGAESLVFEIRGDAELADLVRGLGQLALVAPRPAALTRMLLLPAPRDELGQALAPFAPAFEELSVNVLFYDFEGDAVTFRFERADPALPDGTRRLFD
ncbi:MAG: hypothetical protein AB7L65_01130 [Hyphomonadaceae bacterium]